MVKLAETRDDEALKTRLFELRPELAIQTLDGAALEVQGRLLALLNDDTIGFLSDEERAQLTKVSAFGEETAVFFRALLERADAILPPQRLAVQRLVELVAEFDSPLELEITSVVAMLRLIFGSAWYLG